MDKVERLTELLKRLNTEENPEEVKEETQELLYTIDSAELSSIEQKFVETGGSLGELRYLETRQAYPEMLEDESERMKIDFQSGHVVHTLMSQHEMVLSFLNKLEKVNQAIQQMESYSKDKNEFEELTHIGEHLVEAELYHQQEEEELLLEIEKRVQVMRMEHEELRECKRELRKLVELINQLEFNTFKKRLDSVVQLIALILRDHIFKENNIFIPLPL